MAELDYAFLAEYAKVESGKLTAVGASFLNMPIAPTLNFSVAGRVRSTIDEGPVGLQIDIQAPNDGPSFAWSTGLNESDGGASKYNDKIGYLFALQLAGFPYVEAGLYKVEIRINYELQRTLAFEVGSEQ